MKIFISTAVFLSVIFVAMVSLSGSDEICCTWFNMNYIEGKFPQKIMFHYDGTYATYKEFDSINAITRGTFQITKKWSDSEGFVWYKIIMSDPKKGEKYQLARVSQNGRKLEFICNKNNYPSDLNSTETGYCSYLRASLDYQE